MQFGVLNPFLAGGGTRRSPPPYPAEAHSLEGAVLRTPILIVEDEVLIAWTLRDMLGGIGFTDVRMARDADEAIALAAAHRPGLLICDVNLGAGADGIAAAARIRAGRHVPVLFITGYAGEEIRTRIEAELPGAPLMRKPIEAGPLARCVREVLEAPTRH